MKKAAAEPERGTQSAATFSKTSRRESRRHWGGVGCIGDRNTTPGGSRGIIRSKEKMSTANER
ncbi:hypothetical protein TBK1r_69210 [Stieleria magnilauensis]|uniref:Uncharacterized protein n=1 Tax=Stieleria magnilauensis TaxID=2527963 RepID=A0ABX5Y0X6_9BACT|nr:hypothetical protein TBK1r_69210 [Planctomycetes bacterium TBK1r]